MDLLVIFIEKLESASENPESQELESIGELSILFLFIFLILLKIEIVLGNLLFLLLYIYVLLISNKLYSIKSYNS